MTATKIIFLDIDGVLNCRFTPNPRKFPYIVDLPLLDRFRRVVERSGADVVLSSTWRYDPAGVFSAKHWGIPFTDMIPDFPKQPRRDEILAWLKDHKEVTRFAVLDDEDDDLDELPLFQPLPRTGLTEAMAHRLEAYLAGQTDQDMRLPATERFFQKIAASLRRHTG
jgi:hypothetical protein